MTKSYKEIKGSEVQVQEACWDGYKQVGMKKKGDRMVPNCVKEEIVHAVFGKDYIHREPVMETGMEDMYKGKLNKDQIATIKNTWKNKRASDVTQGVRDLIKKFDTFTRMDLKRANIKYISNLINDEVQQEEFDWISPLQDQIEIVEMNSVVRKTELNEFTTDQINRLAKSYASMSGKTISLANANKLRKMFDRVPDSSLNALRKKRIPFLSGLALSRMIQKKIPVTESAYESDEYAVSIAGIETEREEVELQEGMKLANLVGQSIAHLDMYIELANDIKKEYFKTNSQVSMFIKAKADQAVKSVPKLVKELRRPGIWSEQVELEEDSNVKYKVVDAKTKKPIPDLKDKSVSYNTALHMKKQKGDGYKVVPVDAYGNVAWYAKEGISEADLTKPQVKQVHKQADDLPKKDFMKRYGKDGDAVRYATATNMVKKKLGIGEDNELITKGELKMNESYKLKLNSAMEHYKITSLAELKDEDQKAFFAYVDGLNEEVSLEEKDVPAGSHKMPDGTIMKDKDHKKEETVDEKLSSQDLAKVKKDMHVVIKGSDYLVYKVRGNEVEVTDAEDRKTTYSINDITSIKGLRDNPFESMREEDAYDNDRFIIKNGKATVDNSNTADNKDHVHAPDAKIALQLHKQGKKVYKEELSSAQKKLPAGLQKAIKDKEAKEDLVGGQKKLDKDKDGDLDAKDFAALRKDKTEDHDCDKTHPNESHKEYTTNKVAKEYMNMSASKNKMKTESHGKYLQTKPGSLEEAVLKARGLIK